MVSGYEVEFGKTRSSLERVQGLLDMRERKRVDDNHSVGMSPSLFFTTTLAETRSEQFARSITP